ncbi:hypothetical protein ACP4OV_018056 [Aristida adscensionis]
MPALPLSSADGPGDSAGESDEVVVEGSGGLSEVDDDDSLLSDSDVGASEASAAEELVSSEEAPPLSGEADASDGEVELEGLDSEPLGEPDGDFPDEPPDSEVGASEGVASDLPDGAGDDLGGDPFAGGDDEGALSDLPGVDEEAGDFDGDDDEEPLEPDDDFGEAAGASEAYATTAAAARRTAARARARAMVLRALPCGFPCGVTARGVAAALYRRRRGGARR